MVSSSEPGNNINENVLMITEGHHRCIDILSNPQGDSGRSNTAKLSVYDRFKANVDEHPKAIAIVLDNKKISYEALYSIVSRTSAMLRDFDVRPGDLVSVLFNRSENLVVSLLSILNVGACFLPLDKSLPRERLRKYLAIAKPSFLLTDDKLTDITSSNYLAEVEGCILKKIGDTSSSTEAPYYERDLCYVMFTSGSSGEPKGVLVSCSNFQNVLCALQNKLGFSNLDTMLFATSIGFDISLVEIFLPLVSGATLALYQHAYAYDLEKIRLFIDESSVTFLQATPSAWRLILSDGWSPQKKLKSLSGGERLDKELALRLLQISSEAWNVYGPTETCIWSTLQKLEVTAESVYLGRPLDNTFLLVVNERLHAVEPGEPGELLIGGQGVALGYINSEGSFKNSPFIEAELRGEQQYVYRTGDMVRYDVMGNLVYIGRTDRQVKINGQRVELDEIEVCLSKNPLVESVAVVACETDHEDLSVVAFIVLYSLCGEKVSGVEQLAEKNITQYLREQLTSAMCPSSLSFIEQIPVNDRGKVDYNSLMRRPAKRGHLACDSLNGELEQKLGEIWREILNVDDVGPTDNFFEFGGNSLKAAILCFRVKSLLGVKIDIQDIVNHSQIRPMAAILKERI